MQERRYAETSGARWGAFFGFSRPTLCQFSQIFTSDRFWHTAGAFRKDGHLFQTSSWCVPCVLRASTAPAPPCAKPAPHPNRLLKITLLSAISVHLGLARFALSVQHQSHFFKRHEIVIEWLYLVQCDKFMALCRAMSGPPFGRIIVCTVVALPSAKHSLHIPQKSPSGRCPLQLLSAAAVCCHWPPLCLKHCRRPLPSSSSSRAYLQRRLSSSTLPTTNCRSPPSSSAPLSPLHFLIVVLLLWSLSSLLSLSVVSSPPPPPLPTLLLAIVATVNFFKADCCTCVHLLHVTVPATPADVAATNNSNNSSTNEGERDYGCKHGLRQMLRLGWLPLEQLF